MFSSHVIRRNIKETPCVNISRVVDADADVKISTRVVVADADVNISRVVRC